MPVYYEDKMEKWNLQLFRKLEKERRH